jgi:hypothetical protein
MNRIRDAYQLGHRTARGEQRLGYRFIPSFMAWCPYSTYMPGVQCRVAWQIGYMLAYRQEPPSQASRHLYLM